jgi:kynurenine formamidase
MCLPACTMQLADAFSRRRFLQQASVAACAAAIAPSAAKAEESPHPGFQRVVDLTHTLSASFPTTWPNAFVMEQVSELGKDKWNAYRWHLQEHVGTHLDAPLHCTQGPSGDRIPAEQLVGPLVVVDLRARASTSADTQLTLDDLRAWERQHGPIAAGAVVALYSGWDARVHDAHKFFGSDDHGGFHFPGFHLEAVRFLQEQRDVKGIATDTLSLDPGQSAAFPVHHYWLGCHKWGLENVAGLGQLPATGSTIVVGAPKIAGCTGGPSRVLALV